MHVGKIYCIFGCFEGNAPRGHPWSVKPEGNAPRGHPRNVKPEGNALRIMAIVYIVAQGGFSLADILRTGDRGLTDAKDFSSST